MTEPLAPEERSRRIALLVIGILAPLAEAGLAATFGLLGRGAPGLGRLAADGGGAACLGRTGERRGRWRALLLAGAVALRGAGRRGRCGCWRRSIRSCGSGAGSSICGAGTTGSRLTRRPEQRRFGYYAMPLLWGYDIIGWANVEPRRMGGWMRNSALSAKRPRDPGFQRALDAELAAMESFLAERGGR